MNGGIVVSLDDLNDYYDPELKEYMQFRLFIFIVRRILGESGRLFRTDADTLHPEAVCRKFEKE